MTVELRRILGEIKTRPPLDDTATMLALLAAILGEVQRTNEILAEAFDIELETDNEPSDHL